MILFDDYFPVDDFIKTYIDNSISIGETIDYVTAARSPLGVCNMLNEKSAANELHCNLAVIDCFSPLYAFDDMAYQRTIEHNAKKGYLYFTAKSFAGIHAAITSSWHAFRKRQAKLYKSRLPHRSIYFALSSLMLRSSEDQFISFINHVTASEKIYGTITMLLEPATLDDQVKSVLKRASCAVILAKADGTLCVEHSVVNMSTLPAQ